MNTHTYTHSYAHTYAHTYKKCLLTLAITTGLTMSTLTTPAHAVPVEIPQQPLATALKDLGKQTGLQLLFSNSDLRNLQTSGLSGDMSVEEALQKLLTGTGLRYEYTSDDTVVIKSGTGEGSSVGKRNPDEAGARGILEEIVVTAQKREQRLIDVPMSVFAQTGETLNESGVGDLQSLSLAVPGMFVEESGSYLRRISIRGIGNISGRSSLIGLYIDESAVASSPANQIDLRIHDIERVEVLKGPQGTLYGEGSVGGAIRYITKDPVLEHFEGEVSVDTFFTRGGDASHELRGIANVPIIDDRLGLRVVGQYIDAGGWIDQPARDLEDINSYELSNIRTKLLWRPLDNLDIVGTAIVHRNNAGAQNTGEDEDQNYQQAFGDDSTPSAEDDYDFYSLLFDYDFGDFRLISSSSYLDAGGTFLNSGYQCCISTGVPGQYWNILVAEQSRSVEVFTQEVRISTVGSGPLNGTAGFLYRDAKTKLSFPATIAGVPGGTFGVDIFPLASLFTDEQSQSWAAFGDASYAVTEDLEVGVGLRYFEDDLRYGSAGSVSQLKSVPFQEDTFDSWNPRFFISYGVAEDVRVYANIAKGFRSGGFNAAGAPPYEPESVLSYELGTKLSGMDSRLNAEIALFYSTYDDYQIIGVDLTNLAAGNITSNAGEARVQGIDASLVFLATDNLELGFTGNYTDAEFTEINVVPGTSSHEVGDSLDIVPKYGLSLWGNYSFAWPDGRPGFIRLDYSQQGRAYYTNRSFSPDYVSTSDIINMLNTRIGWSHETWSAELYANNLLNERGFIGATSIERQASRPRPRIIGIRVSASF